MKASPAVDHSRACGLSSRGTQASLLVACGILPDQGSNPCPLHQQADSLPLDHQGSPVICFIGPFQHFEIAILDTIFQILEATEQISRYSSLL